MVIFHSDEEFYLIGFVAGWKYRLVAKSADFGNRKTGLKTASAVYFLCGIRSVC